MRNDVIWLAVDNTLDWEYSSNLSLISISSYVVHGTKETGNINAYNTNHRFGHFCFIYSYHKISIRSRYLHKSVVPNAMFSVNFFKKFDICEYNQAIHICQGVLSQILQKQSQENLLCTKS